MKGKKYSIIVLLICICVSLIGCGKNNSSKSSDSDKKASEISNNSQDTESTNESDNISFEFKKDSNIDETILYDEKEMKIVAKTLEYGNSAVSLKVEITNKTKKQISVVDKNKFEVVVNYENIICDVYYMVNMGINELLIGGDHYFYSFDVLNYKLTRLIEYNEITNKTYSEIGNNKIIVYTRSDFKLKLYKYITEEIE